MCNTCVWVRVCLDVLLLQQNALLHAIAAATTAHWGNNMNNRMTATLFTRVFCTRARVDGHVCVLFHTQFVFPYECVCGCECVLLLPLLVAFVVTFNSYTMANSFHVPPIFIHKTTT